MEFRDYHRGLEGGTAVEWSLDGRKGRTPPKRFDEGKAQLFGDSKRMITDDMIQVMVTELLIMGPKFC